MTERTYWGWCIECEERRLIHNDCGKCVACCCKCERQPEPTPEQ